MKQPLTTYVLLLALATSVSMNLYSCSDSNRADRSATAFEKAATPSGEMDGFSTILRDSPILGLGDLFVENEVGQRWIRNYADHRHYNGQRQQNDSSITTSVYYDEEVFQWLGAYFQTAGRPVDGIRIFFTEYDADNTAPGQAKKNQISLMFVPTKNKKPDWNAWDDMKAKLDKDLKSKNQALNHGELCPTNCK